MRLRLTVASILALAATPAAAQGVDDFAGLLAGIQEQVGQSVGEAMVGGQSVFVTAQGAARIDKPVARPYSVIADGQAETAVEAARLRDAKLDALRAVARRYAVEMTLGDPTYAYGPRPGGLAVRVPPPSPIPSQPAPARPASEPMFTASTPVRFARPPEAAMPAFLDALHAAGIGAFSDVAVNTNILLQATESLGFGAVGSGVGQAVWDRAMTAAVATARAQADTLASAGGRHVGVLRQVMLLSRSVKGGEATVTVAARFGFGS